MSRPHFRKLFLWKPQVSLPLSLALFAQLYHEQTARKIRRIIIKCWRKWQIVSSRAAKTTTAKANEMEEKKKARFQASLSAYIFHTIRIYARRIINPFVYIRNLTSRYSGRFKFCFSFAYLTSAVVSMCVILTLLILTNLHTYLTESAHREKWSLLSDKKRQFANDFWLLQHTRWAELKIGRYLLCVCCML